MTYKINVTCKDGGGSSEYDKALDQAKKEAISVEEYSLVKGFTAEYAGGAHDETSTLQSNDHILVEADGEVKTQQS